MLDSRTQALVQRLKMTTTRDVTTLPLTVRNDCHEAAAAIDRLALELDTLGRAMDSLRLSHRDEIQNVWQPLSQQNAETIRQLNTQVTDLLGELAEAQESQGWRTVG